MSNAALRRPGRPRIHPPKLKLRVPEMCAHPLVRQNLTEEQLRVLDPAFDPPPAPARWEEPADLPADQRRTNQLKRMAVKQRDQARAEVRRVVKRIAQSLFNQGLLTNTPPPPVSGVMPGTRPPTSPPPRIITIEDHNRRITERALAHAISDVALNNERMARVSAHASRRAARTAGRNAP